MELHTYIHGVLLYNICVFDCDRFELHDTLFNIT